MVQFAVFLREQRSCFPTLKEYSLQVMEFVEPSAFTRCLADYLDDASYRSLQRYLLQNPEAGTVMPGTGGFRKVRGVDQRRKKGKSGGIRVIYYYFPEDAQIC